MNNNLIINLFVDHNFIVFDNTISKAKRKKHLQH